MIMLDVGALQLLRSVRCIIVVTSDHFGESVKACFEDDREDSKQPAPMQSIGSAVQNLIYDSSSLPEYRLVPDCTAATLAIGRLPVK